MPKACCDKMADALEHGKVEEFKGAYSVVGCCGSCTVLAGMDYCPWCGSPLSERAACLVAAVDVQHSRMEVAVATIAPDGEVKVANVPLGAVILDDRAAEVRRA